MKKFIKKISVIVLSIITVVCTFCTAAIPAFAASTESVKTGSYYTVSNVGSGKYLNIYGSKNANNTNVTVYQKDGTKGQSFMFTKNGNGYTIAPKCSTSRRVNVYGTSAKQNANVCIWNSTGSSTQRWIVKEVSGGYIICCADNANYVLTATGSKNSSNVNLQKYTGSKYQIWKSSAFTANSYSDTNNSSDFIWPLANGSGSVSSKAGSKRSYEIHVGTDIAASSGTSILAISSGTVKAAGFNSARGYYATIVHGNYTCVYQHMKNFPKVKEGDKVSKGQVIGYVGNTGHSSGNHLHFEIALTSSLTKTGSITNYLYNDVQNKKNPTYYSVSKGSKNGSYYNLNLTKV